MKHRLLCHPDTPSVSGEMVEVEVLDLHLTFTVVGVADLILPERLSPGRSDGLWTTTCFELFLKPKASEAYFEFNFSPSTQWAAYGFEGYRSNMRELEMAPPQIETSASGDSLELRALISPPAIGPFLLGLSAVIEGSGGRKSYWALAHPEGKPDFHHPDSFVHELS